MQKKLQELTEKIYQEGVDKARQEAETIISEAEKKAADILSEAEKKAAASIEKAEKEAADLNKNALNELQLSSRQAISDLKQEIVNLVQVKTIEPEARGAFKELAFTRDIIQSIVDKWDPESSDNVDLQVLLPEKQQKEFELFFKQKARDLLDKGLDVKFSDRLKGGFKIGPKDGSYLVSFSDEDFDHFFKLYMRPRLIELLFGKKAKK